MMKWRKTGGSEEKEVFDRLMGISILLERKVGYQNERFVRLIENKEVADSYKKHFEILWKIAKS